MKPSEKDIETFEYWFDKMTEEMKQEMLMTDMKITIREISGKGRFQVQLLVTRDADEFLDSNAVRSMVGVKKGTTVCRHSIPTDMPCKDCE